MTTNNPTPNPQIEDIVQLVNLEEETILVAKINLPPEGLPEGTKVTDISITLDPPLPGGGWCIIQNKTGQ